MCVKRTMDHRVVLEGPGPIQATRTLASQFSNSHCFRFGIVPCLVLGDRGGKEGKKSAKGLTRFLELENEKEGKK